MRKQKVTLWSETVLTSVYDVHMLKKTKQKRSEDVLHEGLTVLNWHGSHWTPIILRNTHKQNTKQRRGEVTPMHLVHHIPTHLMINFCFFGGGSRLMHTFWDFFLDF